MHGSLLLKLLGVSFAHPLDGGARLVDGQKIASPYEGLFGIEHKEAHSFQIGEPGIVHSGITVWLVRELGLMTLHS
jgi:hypothetical protein